MEGYKKEFVDFMLDSQVLKFGDFTLKSGRKSPFFMNAGLYITGSQLMKLGEYYAKAIHNTYGDDFDVIFGPAYKGIPISVATTIAYSKLFGKEVKEGLVDKYLYKDGKKYIGQIIKSKDSQYQNITNFKRKTKGEYISRYNSKQKNSKKNISLKYSVPTDEFLVNDDYFPLGKNIEANYEETFINKLVLNSVNTNKYLILKIASGLYIDKETKFLCEDINGDIINISMKYIERYFNPKNI